MLASDVMSLVGDCDGESPLVVLVDDFSGANPPLVVVEYSLESVEMVGTAAKFAFDVCASRGGDPESNRPVVFEEQTIIIKSGGL